MLDPKDCKPGVDVVCIKQCGGSFPSFAPIIKLNDDFTIKDFFPKGTMATGVQAGYSIPVDTISLNEIPLDETGEDWCFDITNFKLKYNPKALEIFKFKQKELENA